MGKGAMFRKMASGVGESDDDPDLKDFLATVLKEKLLKVNDAIAAKDAHMLFQQPVTDDIAPQYSERIKHPMDMGTMRAKIDDDEYSSLQEYKADFELMMRNCYSYNGEDTWVHERGKKFEQQGEKILLKEIAKFPKELEKRRKQFLAKQRKAQREAEKEARALVRAAKGAEVSPRKADRQRKRREDQQRDREAQQKKREALKLKQQQEKQQAYLAQINPYVQKAAARAKKNLQNKRNRASLGFISSVDEDGCAYRSVHGLERDFGKLPTFRIPKSSYCPQGDPPGVSEPTLGARMMASPQFGSSTYYFKSELFRSAQGGKKLVPYNECTSNGIHHKTSREYCSSLLGFMSTRGEIPKQFVTPPKSEEEMDKERDRMQVEYEKVIRERLRRKREEELKQKALRDALEKQAREEAQRKRMEQEEAQRLQQIEEAKMLAQAQETEREMDREKERDGSEAATNVNMAASARDDDDDDDDESHPRKRSKMAAPTGIVEAADSTSGRRTREAGMGEGVDASADDDEPDFKRSKLMANAAPHEARSVTHLDRLLASSITSPRRPAVVHVKEEQETEILDEEQGSLRSETVHKRPGSGLHPPATASPMDRLLSSSLTVSFSGQIDGKQAPRAQTAAPSLEVAKAPLEPQPSHVATIVIKAEEKDAEGHEREGKIVLAGAGERTNEDCVESPPRSSDISLANQRGITQLLGSQLTCPRLQVASDVPVSTRLPLKLDPDHGPLAQLLSSTLTSTNFATSFVPVAAHSSGSGERASLAQELDMDVGQDECTGTEMGGSHRLSHNSELAQAGLPGWAADMPVQLQQLLESAMSLKPLALWRARSPAVASRPLSSSSSIDSGEPNATARGQGQIQQSGRDHECPPQSAKSASSVAPGERALHALLASALSNPSPPRPIAVSGALRNGNGAPASGSTTRASGPRQPSQLNQLLASSIPLPRALPREKSASFSPSGAMDVGEDEAASKAAPLSSTPRVGLTPGTTPTLPTVGPVFTMDTAPDGNGNGNGNGSAHSQKQQQPQSHTAVVTAVASPQGIANRDGAEPSVARERNGTGSGGNHSSAANVGEANREQSLRATPDASRSIAPTQASTPTLGNGNGNSNTASQRQGNQSSVGSTEQNRSLGPPSHPEGEAVGAGNKKSSRRDSHRADAADEYEEVEVDDSDDEEDGNPVNIADKYIFRVADDICLGGLSNVPNVFGTPPPSTDRLRRELLSQVEALLQVRINGVAHGLECLNNALMARLDTGKAKVAPPTPEEQKLARHLISHLQALAGYANVRKTRYHSENFEGTEVARTG